MQGSEGIGRPTGYDRSHRFVEVEMNFEGIYFSQFEQQGLRLALAPIYPESSSRMSTAMGHKIFIRNLQDPAYTIEDGLNTNLGSVSYIKLKMLEVERIPPDLGGNCADDTYLMQRFGSEYFGITNETAYFKEVKVQDLDGVVRAPRS